MLPDGLDPVTHELEFTVSDFIALVNQTMEYAYPSVLIMGELANLRISKNRWVYFDLKDEFSTVKFFGTVYQLPGPLEDGMILRVRGVPKLHQLYGFSVNVFSIQPAGEGSIRKAADLLQAKLSAEGLFDESRKRAVPHPPQQIGLITSKQSAAYADFMKIISARWQGVDIMVVDVQVQGEPAPRQIASAIEQFNALAEPPDVLVLIRGGGSAEDLAAFSSELVARCVAASRVPTVVAIGHEIDTCLAELAADLRASTPSNAAELLVPDKAEVQRQLSDLEVRFKELIERRLQINDDSLMLQRQQLNVAVEQVFMIEQQRLLQAGKLLQALSPEATLRRGYAIIRTSGKLVRSIKQLQPDTMFEVRLQDGSIRAITKEKLQ
jgi:exodeoxyribonuclease VII large subunit